MKKEETIFHQYVLEFERYAKRGIQAMQLAFGLDRLSDYRRKKVPREGCITVSQNQLKYRFHGGACEFDFSGVIVNFELMPTNERHVNFTTWDMYQFIKSYDKDTSIQDESTCTDMVNSLELNGVIKKNTNDMPEIPPHYGVYTLVN